MMQKIRQLTFRPSPEPGIKSPLTVRSTGHYRLNGKAETNLPRGFTQLFWVHAGGVYVTRKGQVNYCAAGSGFYYAADEPHHVSDGNEMGEYYWVTFDGDTVGRWLLQQGCGLEPRALGPCPTDLFEQLRIHVGESSLQAEIQASELGLRLLIRFASANAESTATDTTADELLCQQMDLLMQDGFIDAGFGIEQVAQRLGRHRATLFRAYRKQRGMPPSTYLQRLRVQRGLQLLRSKSSPIAEIAPACGFRDANYFTKVIRRAIGESPRSFRRDLVVPVKLMKTKES